MDFFNSAIENYGDALFRDDATPDDLKSFVANLDDEKIDIFVKTIHEAGLI